MQNPTVGVIGTGPMGHPIAATLLAAGRDVIVWNRTSTRADDLVLAGARRAQSLAEMTAPVILSVLPDIHQLQDLLTSEVRRAWSDSGARLVVLSTTGPDRVRDLAKNLEADGIPVIDAPVSGGVAGARTGNLSIMVGGAIADVAAVSGVLEAIGSTVLHLGPLGSGATAKLCNQIVVAGTLASLGEAMGLARRSGLDINALMAVLEGGLAGSEVLRQKKESLRNRTYPLGGSADNQVKDLLYAAEAADQVGLPARIVPVLLELFEATAASGRGQQDHSAVQEMYLDG